MYIIPIIPEIAPGIIVINQKFAISSEEDLTAVEPAKDLLEMDGMDSDLAYHMAAIGIITMEDLAEQSIDELMVVDDMDEEKAGALIMTARAPWFEEDGLAEKDNG